MTIAPDINKSLQWYEKMNRLLKIRKYTRDDGFTLIEVLIVIAIIGIFLAVGSPFYTQWLANIDLRSASRELHSGLQLAKVEAARSNEDVVVAVTVAACGVGPTRYTIFVDDGGGNPAFAGNRTWDPLVEIPIRDVVLPAGDGPCIDQMTGFVPGVQPPGFNPRGLPIAAITGTIRVASTKTPDFLTTTINVAGNITTQ